MPEMTDSRTNRYKDGLYDRNSYLSDDYDDKDEKLKWFKENVEDFNFANPVCPKCDNALVNRQEIHKDHFHCSCGFEAWNRAELLKDIILTDLERQRDIHRSSPNKPKMSVKHRWGYTSKIRMNMTQKQEVI
jgi:ribosomal protein S27AE